MPKISYPVRLPTGIIIAVMLAFLIALMAWLAVRWGRGRAATILVSTMLSLVVTDQAIRLLFPVPSMGYGVWAGYPGSVLKLVVEPDGFQAIHRYNRYGFRGGDFPL